MTDYVHLTYLTQKLRKKCYVHLSVDIASCAYKFAFNENLRGQIWCVAYFIKKIQITRTTSPALGEWMVGDHWWVQESTNTKNFIIIPTDVDCYEFN